MVLSVIKESKRNVYTSTIKVDLGPTDLVYKDKELDSRINFKIENIPVQFVVWDKDYTQQIVTVPKALFFLTKDEPQKSINCEFQDLFISLENWSIRPPNASFLKPVDTSDPNNPGKFRMDQVSFGWGQFFKDVQNEKITKVSGTFTITVEAGNGYMLKERFIRQINPFVTIEHSKEDIQIKCDDGETITFDKHLLCLISDVFRTMLENPNTLESQGNIVILKGVTSATIKTFKDILKNSVIKEDNLSVEMLLFADMYNVQPLVKLCQEHLRTRISRENFMDIVKAADVTNDKELLKAAAKFATSNVGTFDQDQEIKDFIKNNAQCFASVWELMMFKGT